MAKTKIGLEENVAGLLCYVLGFISGIVMFAIERENKFVKFHALQSVTVFLGLWLIGLIMGFLPVIGILIPLLVPILMLFFWVFLMIKAFKGEKYMVPVAGAFVENTLMSKAEEIASQGEARQESQEEQEAKEEKTSPAPETPDTAEDEDKPTTQL